MTSFALMLLLLVPHEDGNHATLRIENGWVREAPPVARVLAAYGRLCNDSPAPVTLSGASSEHFARIEMHATVETDTAATMQRLEDVVIGARDCVDFAPGGRHFMLFEPKHPLRDGDEVNVVLDLGNEKMEIVFPVRRADDMLEEQHGHHHGH